MNRDEIIESNRLIAEFMGARKRTESDLIEPYTVYEFPEEVVDSVLPVTFFMELDRMKFHTSWDWLMPVVKKIGDYLQHLERPSRNHCCKGDMIEVDLHCHLRTVDLGKTWDQVVEFIQWCNYQNQSK